MTGVFFSTGALTTSSQFFRSLWDSESFFMLSESLLESSAGSVDSSLIVSSVPFISVCVVVGDCRLFSLWVTVIEVASVAGIGA